jgi:hypothetical protein
MVSPALPEETLIAKTGDAARATRSASAEKIFFISPHSIHHEFKTGKEFLLRTTLDSVSKKIRDTISSEEELLLGPAGLGPRTDDFSAEKS